MKLKQVVPLKVYPVAVKFIDWVLQENYMGNFLLIHVRGENDSLQTLKIMNLYLFMYVYYGTYIFYFISCLPKMYCLVTCS